MEEEEKREERIRPVDRDARHAPPLDRRGINDGASLRFAATVAYTGGYLQPARRRIAGSRGEKFDIAVYTQNARGFIALVGAASRPRLYTICASA